MRKKLHNNRGETLIEVLASILIASLSVTLLFSCVMYSSTKKYSDEEGVDYKHYEALAAAEARSGDFTPGSVTIKKKDESSGASIDIDIFGNFDDGMNSYKRAEVTGP